MKKQTATIIGFLVAPLVPAVWLACTPTSSAVLSITSVLGWIFVFYQFSLAATLVFGVPLFLLFRRFGLVKWWSTIGAGVAIGGIAALVMRGGYFVDDVSRMSFLGGVSAMVFWMILILGKETKVQMPSNEESSK